MRHPKARRIITDMREYAIFSIGAKYLSPEMEFVHFRNRISLRHKPSSSCSTKLRAIIAWMYSLPKKSVARSHMILLAIQDEVEDQTGDSHALRSLVSPRVALSRAHNRFYRPLSVFLPCSRSVHLPSEPASCLPRLRQPGPRSLPVLYQMTARE